MHTAALRSRLSSNHNALLVSNTDSMLNRARQLLDECRETQRSIDLYTRPTVMLSQPYCVVVVPGQNGVGTDTGYVQRRFEPLLTNMDLYSRDQTALRSIVRAGIPTRCHEIDFGQDRCKALLTEAMQVGDASLPVVLYGNSQGTSTILQWLSDQSVDEQLRKRVVLVVLEAVMASGNSAIWHTVHNWCIKESFLRRAAELLCLDALVCVAVSWFVFRNYRAGDKQAVHCTESFPRHVPVILTHARQDSNLCYNDACAMHYLLKRKLQHPHVYLCTRMDEQHINLYQANIATMPAPNPRFAQVVQHVLRRHYDQLPALFGVGANQDQAEHPVDGAVTHAECYERVLRFDRKVHLCERVLRYAIPVMLITIIALLVLYLV